VSNELGAGRPQAARLAVRVVVLLAVSEGLAVGLILVSVRYVWGHAYSNVEEVVTYVAKMMLVIAVSNFFDGIQCVLSGTELELLQRTPELLFLNSSFEKLNCELWSFYQTCVFQTDHNC
jgi:hypothetical protein